jgi:hypothetical protein
MNADRPNFLLISTEASGVQSTIPVREETPQRPGADSLTRLPRMKAMLAGRSASRRMR